MKLSQFLIGLNDQFTNTRGQILLMYPLPDLSQEYAMLLQDENQRNSVTNMTASLESVAMNARFVTNHPAKNKTTQTKQDDKKLSDVICDYCNLSGHT